MTDIPLAIPPLPRKDKRLDVRQVQSIIGGEWLFGSRVKPSKPIDRRTLDHRLVEAYGRAGLDRLDGGLWHPWRRKWATERKGMPVKDVAAAGGWSDTATLLRSYQQSDEAKLQSRLNQGVWIQLLFPVESLRER